MASRRDCRIERLLQDDPARWRRSRLVMRRDEHGRNRAPLAPQPFIQLEAAHARQIDVDDRAIGRADARQPRLRRVEGPYAVAVQTQESRERTPDVLVILDDDKGGAPIGHDAVIFGNEGDSIRRARCREAWRGVSRTAGKGLPAVRARATSAWQSD